MALLVGVRAQASDRAQPLPCGACLVWSLTREQAETLRQDDRPLAGVPILLPADVAEEVLQPLRTRGARVGLHLVADAADAPLPSGDVVAAAAFVLVSAPMVGAPAERLFAVRRAATQLRASGAPQIVLDADASTLRAWGRPGAIAAYIDAWITPPEAPTALPGRAAWRARSSLDPADLDGVIAAARDANDGTLLVRQAIGVPNAAWLAALGTWLPQGLSPLPDVTVRCEPACAFESWLEPRSLDAIVLVQSRSPAVTIAIAPAAVEVHVLQPDGTEALLPLTTAAGRPTVSGGGRVGSFLLRVRGWRGRLDTVFTSGVEARAPAALSAAEIVARHQAARAAQQRTLSTWIGHGRLAISFDVPGFFTPVSIAARTTTYNHDGQEEVALEDILVNGAPLAAGSDRRPPRLPLVDAARLATPPLVLTLTEEYAYTRQADDTVDGRPVYLLAFERRSGAGERVGGRAWIDPEDFHLARLETVRAGLSGPVVAVEQRDRFGPAPAGTQTVWLPVESRTAQMYEGAGHRTTIQRVQVFDRYDVNLPTFTEQRETALGSNAVMLVSTVGGYRYLIRDRASDAAGAAGALERRGVAPATAGSRIRTLIGGVVLDPNITIPLPFAGLNYTDLNLFGRGIQLNAFFGGTVGQLAWQVPSLWGSRWQLGGDAFAIGARYHDRSFRNGREIYGENIRQRPFRVSAAASRPLTSRARLRVGYELDVTTYGRAETTSSDFRVPVDAWVHGAILGIDAQRGRWTMRGWWNPARRRHWAPWGSAGSLAPATRSFQRVGVSMARALTLSPRLVARTEVEAVAGWRLDRFSRYTVGTLEHVLRGYPGASLRYDRGAIARTAVSWMSVRRLRLSGFADVGVLRDPGFGDSFRGYPGIGAALEGAGPLRTLWSADWGYGIRAPRSSGGVGTSVVRLSVYRVF